MGTMSIFCISVLEVDNGDGCTTQCLYLMPLNCTLKKWLK